MAAIISLPFRLSDRECHSYLCVAETGLRLRALLRAATHRDNLEAQVDTQHQPPPPIQAGLLRAHLTSIRHWFKALLSSAPTNDFCVCVVISQTMSYVVTSQ